MFLVQRGWLPFTTEFRASSEGRGCTEQRALTSEPLGVRPPQKAVTWVAPAA